MRVGVRHHHWPYYGEQNNDFNSSAGDPSDLNASPEGFPLFGDAGLADPFAASMSIGSTIPSIPGILLQTGTLTVPETAGNLTLNLEFDAAATAAPASFRSGIEQAALDLAKAITVHNAVTINFQVQYNENSIPTGAAQGGAANGLLFSYSTVRSDLLATAPAGDPVFSALPPGSSAYGYSRVAVWGAQEKVFGLMNGTSTGVDGTVDFSSSISSSYLVGIALHELTHAMGRAPYGPPYLNAPDLLDLFRFTSAGTILVDDNLPAPATAYFSIDGGVSKLAAYGISSDPSDFLNSTSVKGDPASPLTPNDPFNQYYTAGTTQALTPVDLTLLEALGFNTDQACFAAGTRIGSPQGQIAVEDLRPGMLVQTCSGTPRPVRWIGYRHVDFTRHPSPDEVRPVRIRAGALHAGVPARDLRVSPEHAMFVDGGLVPARLLLNGTSIVRESECRCVTWYQSS